MKIGKDEATADPEKEVRASLDILRRLAFGACVNRRIDRTDAERDLLS